MRKQTLSIVIIAILAVSITGIAYATNTSISNVSTTLNNLTVIGTCTGCGGSSNIYSNYNTIALNTTIAGSTSGVFEILVGNNGTVSFSTNQISAIVTISGSVITSVSSGTNPYTGYKTIDQSTDGYYQVIGNYSNNVIEVIKNNSFLQNLGFDNAQCLSSSLNSIAISPNGKYIATGCLDSGGSTERIIVFQGS